MMPSTNVDGEPREILHPLQEIRGFNEAVDERRRRGRVVEYDESGRGASMRPSTNVDGETCAVSVGRPARSRFNEAVDERRRRVTFGARGGAPQRGLNEAVDERRRREVWCACVRA